MHDTESREAIIPPPVPAASLPQRAKWGCKSGCLRCFRRRLLFDFLEAADVRIHTFVNTKHVHGNDHSKYVHGVLKIVGWLKKRGKMPVEPITQVADLRNERGGLLRPVVLYVKHG